MSYIDKGPELPLFAKPKTEEPKKENNPEQRNLRLEAAEFIDKHPQVADMFLRFAREMASKGRPFGIGLLAERVRWECAMTWMESDDYKINNNHRAYLARWLIQKDPGLERFMRFRTVQW